MSSDRFVGTKVATLVVLFAGVTLLHDARAGLVEPASRHPSLTGKAFFSASSRRRPYSQRFGGRKSSSS
jgi:hypothetical protein